MNLRVHPSRIQPESTAQIRVSDPERHHDDPRTGFRDRRIVENIRTLLQATSMLKQHASLLEISIEQSAVVIRGNLPTDAMKAELVPIIRRAGVLSQVNNRVLVAA